MKIGVIGLGRMGANIVRRLLRAGHGCVVYDANPAPWWLSTLWLVFFVFAFSYLMVNLLRLG